MKNILFILLVVLASCKTQSTRPEVSLEKDAMQKLKFKAVTVKDFKGLDGCSFLIVPDDSSENKMEAVNLADSLKIPELKLWIRYHDAVDHMSICMAGKMIIIDEVKFRNQ